MANITWDSSNNMTTSNSPTSTCSKTQGNSWDNYARSSTTITKGSEETYFRATSTSTHWGIGLYDASGTAPTSMSQCTYVIHPTWTPDTVTYDYTVSGADIDESHGSWSQTDYFEFQIQTDGSLEFNKNGTDVRVLSGNEMGTTQWKLFVTMYTNGVTTASTLGEGSTSGSEPTGDGGLILDRLQILNTRVPR